MRVFWAQPALEESRQARVLAGISPGSTNKGVTFLNTLLTLLTALAVRPVPMDGTGAGLFWFRYGIGIQNASNGAATRRSGCHDDLERLSLRNAGRVGEGRKVGLSQRVSAVVRSRPCLDAT